MWLGTRDALSGPDVNRTYWKFRFYSLPSAYADQQLTTLYFGGHVTLVASDGHQHENAALMYKSHLDKFSDARFLSTRPSYCQLNGNTKIYDVTGSNRRVVPPAMLDMVYVTSLFECQQKCVYSAICLGFNIGPPNQGKRMCELVAWLLIDAGFESNMDSFGWYH